LLEGIRENTCAARQPRSFLLIILKVVAKVASGEVAKAEPEVAVTLQTEVHQNSKGHSGRPTEVDRPTGFRGDLTLE
jgi:hypothetical protein